MDDYYYAEPRGLLAADLLESMRRKNIKYYFGKINNSTDKMITEFRRIAGDDIVEVTDIKEPRFLGNAVIKSVTKTIDVGRSIYGLKDKREAAIFGGSRQNKGSSNYMDSMKPYDTDTSTEFISLYLTDTSERGGKSWDKKLKPFNIVDKEPDYSNMRLERNVKWLECEMPALVSAESIQRNIGKIHHRWRTATIKRASGAFVYLFGVWELARGLSKSLVFHTMIPFIG